MQKARVTAVLLVGALLLAFGGGLYAGVSERAASAQGFSITNVISGGGERADLAEFWAAWELLEERFVQTQASGTIPTDEEKIRGAIAGLVESYGDPYTVYLPPKEAKQFNEDISGEFGGVGMELGERDGLLTVVAPLKNTPAAAAGVRAGDVIVAIDGEPSQKMPVDEAVSKIRGQVGTTVKITLKRQGESRNIELTITRAVIQIPIIKHELRDGVYTIELYSFSQNSPALFRQALRSYFESGATKLVLDLRGNPGGYLEAAVQMASYFLPVGEMIVSEDFGGRQQDIVHRSVGYNVFANKKLSMVVLVDQGSASASEILAGALQQHGVAKLVGERTFGKGSVQQLIELGGGGELKITVAKWLTPNGQSISDGGLTPDISAKRTAEDAAAGKDPQRDAALSWLATQ